MPERRQFKVHHTNAKGFMDWSANTIQSEGAFGHFLASLESAGHSRDSILTMHVRLTLALMDGRNEFSVPDSDLKGSTTISITATT